MKLHLIDLFPQDRERRPGDVPISVADPSLAYKYLGWRSKRTLTDMCKDSWPIQKLMDKKSTINSNQHHLISGEVIPTH